MKPTTIQQENRLQILENGMIARVKYVPPPGEAWWAERARAFLAIAKQFQVALEFIASANQVSAPELRKVAKTALEEAHD